MDKETAIRQVSLFADVVRREFSTRKVVLFGSFAKDCSRQDSDIDVAVVVSRIDQDFLTSAARLYRLRRDIDPRIEPVLFTEDDDDRSGFLEEIMKTGIVVYNADEVAKAS
jgi:uncharacterized protein